MLDPDVISAIASVIAAGGAICIPAVLWYSAQTDRREADARAEALRRTADAKVEAAAMNALAKQWQAYNLAVASSDDMATALPDKAFEELDVRQRRRLHYAFFKLTALHQVFEALERRAIRSEWAEVMLAEIGATVFEDRVIADAALSGRGYTDRFKRRLRWYDPARHDADYIHDVEEPSAPEEQVADRPPSSWPKWITLALVLATMIAVLTASYLLASSPAPAEKAECVAMRNALIRPTRATRPDLPDVYRALGCGQRPVE